MASVGSYNTSFPLSTRIDLDIADKIAYISESEVPFLTIFNKISKEVTNTTQFAFFEDEPFIVFDAGATDSTLFTYSAHSGTTNPGDTLTLSTGSQGFRSIESAAEDISTGVEATLSWTESTVAKTAEFYIRPQSGTFPLDRAAGTIVFEYRSGDSVAGAASADTGFQIQVRTPSTKYSATDITYGGIAQGAAAPEETRKKTVRKDAYTQIVRTPYTIVGSLLTEEMYGGPELNRLRWRKAKQHRIEIQYPMLFSGRGSSSVLGGTTPSGSTTTTYMTGLGIGAVSTGTGSNDDRGWIRTHNYHQANGGTDTTYQIDVSSNYQGVYVGLMDIMEAITEVGNPFERWFFCSRPWVTAVARGVMDHTGTDAQWDTSMSVAGVQVDTFKTPHGKIHLVPTPCLKGKFSPYCAVLDMSSITVRPKRGRDTMLRQNIAAAEVDGQMDEYLTEIGLQVVHEEANAILYLNT